MKNLLSLCLASSVSVAWALPEVVEMTVSQDVASRRVTVEYALNEPAIVTFGVKVKNAKGEFEPLAGEAVRNVSGAVNCLVSQLAGQRIYWQPDANWQHEGPLSAGDVRVELTAWDPASPPDYIVFDLTKTDVTRYYVSESALPNPLTNDIYKTSLLVLRRIPAAGVVWNMGSDSSEPGRTESLEKRHAVTFTKDFYIGVYEVTVAQWGLAASATFYRDTDYDGRSAARGIAYDSLRGSTADGINWPTTAHQVSSGSYMQSFRDSLGVAVDLPTAAQWEYACRAGTGSACYNGAGCSETNVALLGWCGKVVSEATVVGLKKPNRWGLFDMYGNVSEWVLDWVDPDRDFTQLSCTDPKGFDSGTTRSVRGSGFSSGWSGLRSAFVQPYGPEIRYATLGLRLCLTLK